MENTHRRLIGIVLAATACAIGNAEANVPCRIDGKGELVFQIGQGEKQSGRRVLGDCTGLKALSDGVVVCYLSAAGRPMCSSVANGALFEPAEISKRATSIFARLQRLAEGTRQSTAGGLRAAGATRKGGFPYGRLYLGEGALTIEPVDYAQIELITVMRSDRRGPPVFQAKNAPLPLRIPAAALSAGESYVWQARAGKERFRGGFSVLGPPASDQLARDLQAIRDNPALSEEGRFFLEAVVFEYHGLEAEAARALQKLK